MLQIFFKTTTCFLFLAFFSTNSIKAAKFDKDLETQSAVIKLPQSKEVLQHHSSKKSLSWAEKVVARKLEKKITKMAQKDEKTRSLSKVKRKTTNLKDWGPDSSIPRDPLMFGIGCVLMVLGGIGLLMSVVMALSLWISISFGILIFGIITSLCGLFFPELLNILLLFTWLFDVFM